VIAGLLLLVHTDNDQVDMVLLLAHFDVGLLLEARPGLQGRAAERLWCESGRLKVARAYAVSATLIVTQFASCLNYSAWQR
jgi:hypothetical protein